MEEQKAAHLSGPEFSDDSVLCADDMEGTDGGDQVGVSCSSGAEVAYSVVDTVVIIAFLDDLVAEVKLLQCNLVGTLHTFLVLFLPSD